MRTPKELLRGWFTGSVKITNLSMKRWNIVLAAVHAAQGIVLLLFSTVHDVPVTVSFLTTDTFQTKLSGGLVTAPAAHQLLVINLAYAAAAGFFVAAVAHVLAATVCRQRYEAGLRKGRSALRWSSYALMAGFMLVTIGLLAGVYDAASLILLYMLALLMGTAGFAMEAFPRRGTALAADRLAGGIAVAAGCAPWGIIALYLLATNIFGSGHVPGFVYWLSVSVLASFVLAGLNAYLTHMRKGKWASYWYAERWYMVLALVAQSLLAWQVFAGLLHP